MEAGIGTDTLEDGAVVSWVDAAIAVSGEITCPVCSAICHRNTHHNLTICDHCSHIFQTDLAITVSYDAAYVGQYDSRPVREMSELRWRFIQSALNLPRGSRILDVGYGNGVFLKNARDLGMDIFGIEVHSQDYGIPRVAFDTTLSFDLISFFDSLEHFATFDAIMNLSAKNVVVSIPNRPACLASTPNLWRHYKPGEHLHYFSSASLDHLMRNWGFDQKIAEGFPEDELRGKLVMADETVNNIYTAIYTRR